MTGRKRRLGLLITALAADTISARVAGCELPRLGAGRVAAIIDATSVRLSDGREVKLAGLATLPPPRAARETALAQLLLDQEVELRGASDAPDRHGRQRALLYRAGDDVPVQVALLRQGEAVAAGDLDDPPCRNALQQAEQQAREAGRGMWRDGTAIKNPENTGEIMSRVGQFTVVEGRVNSVRSSGATTYVNFGRRWTRDFAVTVAKQQVRALETAGLTLKALERRRVRVRGFVGKRLGPHIEIRHMGQIELIGDR